MSEADKPKKRIKPPKKSVSADAARAAAVGTVGMVPLAGSLLGELADALLPDPNAIERERWEGEVTENIDGLHGRVDTVEERLGPSSKTTLSGLPASVLATALENCPKGLPWWQTIDEGLTPHFPEETPQALRDALADLEMHGMMESMRSLGPGGYRYRLTEDAYEQCDGQIMGWDNATDARALAATVLGAGQSVSVPELHKQTGWSLRRFNPALRRLLLHVKHNHISKTLTPEYPTLHFHVDDLSRAQLRAFIAG